MTNLRKQSPAEIDTKLAEIYEEAAPFTARLRDAQKTIRRYEKARHRVPEYLAKRVEENLAKQNEVLAKAEPLQAEFSRRGGWNRFFLVSDGHVHYRHCHTLHPTTQVGWIPELAAATEDQMVERFGHVACTICFPSAPLHPAFIRTAAEAAKVEQAKVASKCEGSGRYDWKPTQYPRYGQCPCCGSYESLTSTGKLRSHKPKAAS